MKQKKILKKLNINRCTVANLNMLKVTAGATVVSVDICPTDRPVMCNRITRVRDCGDSIEVVNCGTNTDTDTGGTQCNTGCASDCYTCITC